MFCHGQRRGSPETASKKTEGDSGWHPGWYFSRVPQEPVCARARGEPAVARAARLSAASAASATNTCLCEGAIQTRHCPAVAGRHRTGYLGSELCQVHSAAGACRQGTQATLSGLAGGRLLVCTDGARRAVLRLKPPIQLGPSFLGSGEPFAGERRTWRWRAGGTFPLSQLIRCSGKGS